MIQKVIVIAIRVLQHLFFLQKHHNTRGLSTLILKMKISGKGEGEGGSEEGKKEVKRGRRRREGRRGGGREGESGGRGGR
jgi:hypothetical protein